MESIENAVFSVNLSDNEAWIKSALANCADFSINNDQYGPKLKLNALVVYCESLARTIEILEVFQRIESLIGISLIVSTYMKATIVCLL